MQAWVEVKQLKKKIDSFQFGPNDFHCEPGTITALVGRNGAGKSTFLKLLMDLATKDAGEITICGQEIDGVNEDWKQKIAYMPQTLSGCDPFTGHELQKLTAKWYPTWDQALFEKLVQMFELPLNKPYRKLSQGVQQQLKIALTLPRDTDILILDEPTAHMDIPAKQLLIDVLVAWMERGDKVMIIATHQVEDIRKLADYLVIFQNGQILGRFEKEELSQQYRRYWLQEPLPPELIPGEIERRNERMIVTNCRAETEDFFTKGKMKWIESQALELAEIITFMLKDSKREGDKNKWEKQF